MPVHPPTASLLLVLVPALLLRIGWCLLQPGQVDPRLPDQHEYLELARNLLAGNGLVFDDPRFNQSIRAFRTPGYPLFVAAAGASPRAVRLLQALLDTSTVLAVYLLARRWLEHRAALLAALAVAFNPFLIYFTGLVLSETLFTAMLAWGAVLLVWRMNYLWGGLVLALAILVRPSAVFLPLIMGIAASFVNHQRDQLPQPTRWPLPVGASMLLLTGLVLTPWAIRNRTVLGNWVLLTTNSGITRYDGFNPDATGASDQRFLQSPEMTMLRQMDEVSRDRYLSEKADHWIAHVGKNRPDILIQLTANKLARTWSPIPLSQEFGRPIYRWAAALYAIPFDVLIVLGVCAASLPDRRSKVFLLIPAAYFTAVHALSVGSLRYRVPVEPLLAVLAAAGMLSLLTRIRDRIIAR